MLPPSHGTSSGLVAPEADLRSGKHEILARMLEELRSEGHRVLVFSQFVDHLAGAGAPGRQGHLACADTPGAVAVQELLRLLREG